MSNYYPHMPPVHPPYGGAPPQNFPQQPYAQHGQHPYQSPPPQNQPPGQYNRPPPGPPGPGYPLQHQQSFGYMAPPPQHTPYGAPYPHGGPPVPHGSHPQGGGSPYPQGPPQGSPPGQFNAPPQFPPQGQGYGPGPGQGHFQGPPPMPSPGYVPGQQAQGEFRPQADALRKSMKGFGTDEKALIGVICKLDPLQMAAVRSTYTSHIRRDLYKDVKSETSGYLRQGLLAVIDGPLAHDVSCARDAVQGIGTKEWLLNDVLLGRSNADLEAIKSAYHRTYGRSLQKDVEGDLSYKTLGLFCTVLRASRHEENVPLDGRNVEAEAARLHGATAGRMTNNVEEVCGIFARSSDTELRAISHAYASRYGASLEKNIEKEFSGHMKDALLVMLRTASDPAMRDAELLEDCMKGMGTKDEKLVVRVVRVHWNRQHLSQVKGAYRHRYGKDLVDRVRGETSGDYQRLIVALLE